MTPFFAALSKDFPSTRVFHACAKAVLLVTGAYMGLISSFRHRYFSSILTFALAHGNIAGRPLRGQSHHFGSAPDPSGPKTRLLSEIMALCETNSVVEVLGSVKRLLSATKAFPCGKYSTFPRKLPFRRIDASERVPST